jgi:hypothetical protein
MFGPTPCICMEDEPGPHIEQQGQGLSAGLNAGQDGLDRPFLQEVFVSQLKGGPPSTASPAGLES